MNCSVIPLDFEEGTLMGNSLRVFNLHRLKTIIEQRNQAAITFDSAAAAAAAAEADEAKVGEEGITSTTEANSSSSERRWNRTTEARGGHLFLSVKNVVFSQYEEENSRRPPYYIYDYVDESLEADDEADWEDLLSLSIVDLRPSNISYAAGAQRRAATASHRPLRGKGGKGGQKTRRSAARSASLQLSEDGLSVRGQNYASFGRYVSVIREIKVQVMARAICVRCKAADYCSYIQREGKENGQLCIS